MLANLYLAPPQFAEVGNYRDDTQTAEQVYLETPGHNLLRNLVGGGILLTLSLAGILLAGFSLRGAQPTLRRKLTILLLGTVSQVAVHLSTIPLPWQRYVMPLLPYTCLWSAYAVGSLLSKAERKT